MDHWEELAREYELAIAQGQTERARRLLGEFALTAPASRVRQHYRLLRETTAGCARYWERVEPLLRFARQRASITEALSLIGSGARAKRLKPKAAGERELA